MRDLPIHQAGYEDRPPQLQGGGRIMPNQLPAFAFERDNDKTAVEQIADRGHLVEVRSSRKACDEEPGLAEVWMRLDGHAVPFGPKLVGHDIHSVGQCRGALSLNEIIASDNTCQNVRPAIKTKDIY